jgi:surface antigen
MCTEIIFAKKNLLDTKISRSLLGLIIIFSLITNLTSCQTQAIAQNNQTIITGNLQNLTDKLSTIDSYTPLIYEKESIVSSDQEAFFKKIISNKTYIRSEIDAKIAKPRTVIARERVVSNTQQTIQSKKSYNGYIYGFCTWYVANKRPDIPNNWGNAKNWFNNAKKDGYKTGNTPETGSIMVTNESWAGHVTYVEKVEDNKIYVSEMNFVHWNKTNSRTIDINSPIIKGYIY